MLKNRSWAVRLGVGHVVLLLGVSALPMALAFGEKREEQTEAVSSVAGVIEAVDGDQSLTVTFGVVQSEGAAGSLYYKLPLAEVVQTVSSGTKTFVGCYTLRLAQPAVQGTPPFEPMGIIDGTFTQVANGTDVAPLLVTACP